MNQHLIQEKIRKIINIYINIDSKNDLRDAEDALMEAYCFGRAEVIEEVEKKIEKLYSGFEDNKPVVFASISEQHYNQGLYQGRLNAMEIVTQDLFGINGDELKSTISSLKESLPAKSEEK